MNKIINILFSFLIIIDFKTSYVNNNTLFFINCQEKDYDKIRQITTEATIPAISAANAAISIPLVFLMPTTLVYIAIV